MIRPSTLSRHIVLTMIVLTISASVTAFFGSFVGYMILYEYTPDWVNTESWMPSGTDWGLLLLLAIPSIGISGFVSIKLADRILAPLNSLAQSARRIADGDLDARADAGNGGFTEIALLAADFNQMAEKLQDNASSMSAWNAAVAHEIRTPLTVLKGRVQGAIDGVFPAETLLFENLMSQIDILSTLVDDLRTVTLADSGRLQLRIETVPLASVVSTAIDIMRPSLERSGFSIVSTLEPITIAADPMRIHQALLALLTNVELHAMPGRVIVRCGEKEGRAMISVEDEGPGLPPQFVKHAFDPFMRVQLPTSAASAGSGLGLSVVRAIALAHGGTIRYREAQSGGSIFKILLPLD